MVVARIARHARSSGIPYIAGNMVKTFTLKILSKLAAVVVALLLYGVLVILQTPRSAHAAATPSPAAVQPEKPALL